MGVEEYIGLLLASPGSGSESIDGLRRRFILECLDATSHIPGGVAEFGCWQGYTSAFISESLKHVSPEKQFHVYDTFNGLTGRRDEDVGEHSGEFVEGAICASRETFEDTQRRYGVQLPIIHELDVCNLSAEHVSPFSFVYLDMDYYAPTLRALECIWPLMPVGGMVLIDDYFFLCTPGVPKAVHEFFKSRNILLRRHEAEAQRELPSDLETRQCFRASHALGVRKLL